MRILLVEDDAGIARFVRKGLTEQSYAVDVVTTGEEALYQATVGVYDCIILDVIIPAPDGLEVCRRLREEGVNVPILMLTARDAVSDRIGGLDAGADDYLVKPFEFGELLARVRAMLRRVGAAHKPVLTVGSLEIDTRSHRVQFDGHPITLTTKEYALLEFFARNAGQIVGREEIADHVWNQGFDPFSNLIEVYVNRLRRTIEKVSNKKLIHTVRGSGYMLEEREE
ncbi:MAG TPA: response regulator transcription factor [Thermoanaerobaculia bacterium]|jgi:two-component system copper resistance phosphate regulon response regulator CusR|nr:response regulator transcription factor [Thermoanaerobaculia bacterium]